MVFPTEFDHTVRIGEPTRQWLLILVAIAAAAIVLAAALKLF